MPNNCKVKYNKLDQINLNRIIQKCLCTKKESPKFHRYYKQIKTWPLLLNDFNKLYCCYLTTFSQYPIWKSISNILHRGQMLILLLSLWQTNKINVHLNLYDYEWMIVEQTSTYQRTAVKRIYLCMLACPPVKSVVDCHNVCFLGWGLVSRKKSGCLATCNSQYHS